MKKAALEIELTPVDSSNIEAIGHHAPSNTLRIRFLSGDTYDYGNVSPEKATALMKAESVGSHFHKHIRSAKGPLGAPLHPFQKVV